MKLRPQTIDDVEMVLTGLLGVIGLVKRGNRQQLDDGAFSYAHQVVVNAEGPLRRLGMYEATLNAIVESERLVNTGQLDDADVPVLTIAREMMDKSGTNARLRKRYTPTKSTAED